MSKIATGLAAVAVGFAAGMGAFTFVYARGASYLTNEPTACVNCHVMRPQYAAWQRSSHRAVAVCNDCHTPRGAVAKYAVKALNGFRHSFAFTTGRFREPIVIHDSNRDIAESACRICHQDIVAAIDTHQGPGRMRCTRCHYEVGHAD